MKLFNGAIVMFMNMMENNGRLTLESVKFLFNKIKEYIFIIFLKYIHLLLFNVNSLRF